MIFQSTIDNIDSEISQLLAQVEVAKQRQTQLIELDALTDHTLEGLADVVSKIQCSAPDAIASLKSAVLGLFDSGNDGGNKPTEPAPDDPTPRAEQPHTYTPGSTLVDENGSLGIVIGINNVGMSVDWLGLGSCPNPASGKGIWYNWAKDSHALASLKPAEHDQIKLFSTEEFLQFQNWDSDQLDELWDGEWVSDYGCQYRWGGATIDRWIVAFAQSCEWASPFASPITCLLWEDAPLLGQHCFVSFEDNENKGTKEGEAMPYVELVKVSDAIAYQRKHDGEIICCYVGFRTKAIAQSWKPFFEAITSSVELRQAKRLEGCNKWEIKAKGVSIKQVERFASECDFSRNYQQQTESPAQAAGIEPPDGWGKPQPDPMTCILGEGDVVEVVTHRHPAHHGLIGTVEALANFSELSLQVKTPRGSKGYQRDDLKLVSKAQKPQQPTGLQAGTVLMGNRIVTTGAYVGQARANSISMTRMGTANKVAALELMKAGLSREEAMAAVTGTQCDDLDF
jgi:hypothetical protein